MGWEEVRVGWEEVREMGGGEGETGWAGRARPWGRGSSIRDLVSVLQPHSCFWGLEPGGCSLLRPGEGAAWTGRDSSGRRSPPGPSGGRERSPELSHWFGCLCRRGRRV